MLAAVRALEIFIIWYNTLDSSKCNNSANPGPDRS